MASTNMCKYQLSRSTIVEDFEKAMHEAAYPISSIKRKRRYIGYVASLMALESIDSYTPEAGVRLDLILQEKIDSGEISKTKRSQTSVLLRQLNCLYNDISLSHSKRTNWTNAFPEDYRKLGEAFLASKRIALRWSVTTERMYLRVLCNFAEKMALQGITPSAISYDHVLTYLASVINLDEMTVRPVRSFLEFLHFNGTLKNPVHHEIVIQKTKRKEKIPSVYTPEEIAKLENSIDRGTSKGKRDYAIILLASRLGLRSSDIRKLCFHNIDWDECTLKLEQFKTKRPIVLPLLNDVGTALIDYILHGRPNIESKSVFLRHDAPFVELSASTISCIVSDAIHNANIPGKKRHRGAHALRHSVATAMLENSNPLHIISSTLGHETVESTKYYLGVSVRLLMECSHEVPPVPDEFYEQKGGVLYV